MDCLFQKGRVQLLLLITVLATAATEKHEYDSKEVRRIIRSIHSFKMHKAEVKNADARLEWDLLDYNQVVHFEVKNWKKSLDETCGGGPTLAIDNGPIHCFSKMLFKVVTIKGKELVRLALVIQNSEDHGDWKMIMSDLFKKPENRAGDLPDVVQVQPITKEQVARAVFKKSFEGSASWIKNLLQKGIYLFNPKPERKSEKYPRDLYQASPTVMEAETLNEVLDLLLKNNQNDVKTPPNDDRDEISDQVSVKQLVDFWNKAEKQ